MADKSFLSEKKDKEWFSNFFFYYGKYVIAGTLLLLFLIYGLVTCINRTEYDLEMYYFAGKSLELSAFDNVEKNLSDVVDDIDGKQGVNVAFSDYSIDYDDITAAEMNTSLYMKIQAELSYGDGYLYIMNDKWLKFCSDAELLQDISQYTGDDSPCYYVEVTDNKLLNDLGVKCSEKLYAGVRILDNDRKNKELYINRHKNALKVIKYIIENK